MPEPRNPSIHVRIAFFRNGILTSLPNHRLLELAAGMYRRVP